MRSSDPLRWLHPFACLTAGATFLLIIAGGLVTSTGSGLAVPDWPLSFGMLMPPMVGGIFYEHGHRMVAGTVAVLMFALMVWLARREPRGWVRGLGFAAFGAIVLQAVLGGMTVLLLLPASVSVTHACLAQSFFCLTVTIALVTSPRWAQASSSAPGSRGSKARGRRESATHASAPEVRSRDSWIAPAHSLDPGGPVRAASAAVLIEDLQPDSPELPSPESLRPGMARLAIVFFAACYIQLALGAFMRHTDAGLAIPDFPLSFGRLVPPHWSAPIAIHFAHRIWALVVLGLGISFLVRVLGDPAESRRYAVRAPAILIGALLPLQIALGALTVLSSKQVALATAHVATGALLLATGLVVAIRLNRAALEKRFAERRRARFGASGAFGTETAASR